LFLMNRRSLFGELNDEAIAGYEDG
jgi:hypothetical protein